MALCTTAVTLLAGTRSLRSPADKLLAAVLAGSPWSLDGDISVQTFLTDHAAPPIEVTEVVLAGNCPDLVV